MNEQKSRNLYTNVDIDTYKLIQRKAKRTQKSIAETVREMLRSHLWCVDTGLEPDIHAPKEVGA